MRFFLYKTPLSCTRSGDRELVLITIEDSQTEETADQKFMNFQGRAQIDPRRGYTRRELDLSTGAVILDTVIC